MRWLTICVLSLAMATAAGAQANVPIQQSQISLSVTYPASSLNQAATEAPQNQVPTTSLSVPATVFLPPGQGRHPAIVFAHDGKNGVNAGVKSRCEDLAREGFVVLAPDYQGDGLGKAVKNEAAIHTLMAAREYLNEHPRVKQNFVGLMGTSEGGYLALQAAIAEMGRWNCVVQASGAIDVPSTNTRIQSQVLLQHGDKDKVVLRKHANYLDATLRKAGTSCELKEYTLLDHDFWFWEGKDYTVEQKAQADWAWEDVVNFLHDNLGGEGAGTNAR